MSAGLAGKQMVPDRPGATFAVRPMQLERQLLNQHRLQLVNAYAFLLR